MERLDFAAIVLVSLLSTLLATTAGAAEREGVRKIREIDFSGRPPFKRTVRYVETAEFARLEVDRSPRKRSRIPAARSLLKGKNR